MHGQPLGIVELGKHTIEETAFACYRFYPRALIRALHCDTVIRILQESYYAIRCVHVNENLHPGTHHIHHHDISFFCRTEPSRFIILNWRKIQEGIDNKMAKGMNHHFFHLIDETRCEFGYTLILSRHPFSFR
ncbi:hypothetical protein PUN28_019980 [Cardiocondyla obscurior]|uniref:Uncharacterized protein n=1 Tax=Cardiocondyla obscurior TaxID=286306 RepID=A0AAW2EA97_9HYME